MIGNGSLLVTLSARGEVERLLWPHVDGPNAIVELRLGLLRGGEADAAWLDEDAHSWAQAWAGESSVLRTTATTDAGPVLVEDAVDPDEPVLVRRVEGPSRSGLVVTCAPRLGGDTLVHRRLRRPGVARAWSSTDGTWRSRSRPTAP